MQDNVAHAADEQVGELGQTMRDVAPDPADRDAADQKRHVVVRVGAIALDDVAQQAMTG